MVDEVADKLADNPVKPVLMDFYAEWCGPCKIQGPIFDELKKDFGDRVEFRKIDVDKAGDLPSKYGVFVVPTLVLEKDGQEINKWMGVTSKEDLAAALHDVLK